MLVCLLGIGLGLGKMCDRLSKFTIIASSGAFLFAILDTFRRMGTGLLSIWLFDEAFSVVKLATFILCLIALLLNSLGDSRLTDKKEKASQDGGSSLAQGLLLPRAQESASPLSVAEWTTMVTEAEVMSAADVHNRP